MAGEIDEDGRPIKDGRLPMNPNQYLLSWLPTNTFQPLSAAAPSSSYCRRKKGL
jgi:hypothetical protein